MTIRTLTTALAMLYVLSLGSESCADITLNIGGGDVTFTGNSTGSGASLTFTGFDVTSDPGGDKDSVGFTGSLTGSYSYSITGLSSGSLIQTATLTPNSGAEITIKDGSGQTLDASITGITITAIVLSSTSGPTFGGISGSIKLGSVTYAGTSADLLALKNGANAGDGQMQLNFQFTSAESLIQLAQKNAKHTTSYSGELSVIGPEPSTMTLAALGALGLIGYGLRRRKARGA